MKPIYTFLFALIIMACENTEKNNSNASNEDTQNNNLVITQHQFNSNNMQLGKLTNYTFTKGIKVNGTIDVPPKNKAVISTYMGGYITKTPLLVGDKVKKGQVLATIENPDFIELQQDYLEISEQLNYLKAEFNRQKTLFDENITSQKNYLKAESTYKSNLAHYNGLRKKLLMLHINPLRVEKGHISSKINIYSPIEGYITKVNISNGMHVAADDVIMEIIDTDHIHLELSVFEKDILRIKKGQNIRFKIPEASNETFNANVHLVGTTINDKTRVVKVHAHILNEANTNFIVGMFVEALILTTTTTNLALANNAVNEDEEGAFALVLKEKKNNQYYFEKIALKLGSQTETHTEIINANEFADKDILIAGGFMLGDNFEGSGHAH
ncbi:efflux RND transporter periplasmic adaptor subunit [Seonamhaeicola algicola]|uniref:Efflux RND transporter periplasmic adaptor subunit n=1 Tax=Seonamhaeicola algicola TaxID=1719036 RepID=A0A5C7B0C4_9FLAO|nr:efflux RND transporter periplasmic adaptor subunit [Seonamhaeicola algicola]TXE13219.1 efflux RND transporter periplasmic adaptor subunit [Seonamhaeicola algicola]